MSLRSQCGFAMSEPSSSRSATPTRNSASPLYRSSVPSFTFWRRAYSAVVSVNGVVLGCPARPAGSMVPSGASLYPGKTTPGTPSNMKFNGFVVRFTASMIVMSCCLCPLENGASPGERSPERPPVLRRLRRALEVSHDDDRPAGDPVEAERLAGVPRMVLLPLAVPRLERIAGRAAVAHAHEDMPVVIDPLALLRPVVHADDALRVDAEHHPQRMRPHDLYRDLAHRDVALLERGRRPVGLLEVTPLVPPVRLQHLEIDPPDRVVHRQEVDASAQLLVHDVARGLEEVDRQRARAGLHVGLVLAVHRPIDVEVVVAVR